MKLADMADKVEGTAAIQRAVFEVSAIDRLDSTGALLLQKLRSRLEASNIAVELAGLREDHRPLLDYAANLAKAEALTETPHHPLLAMVERLGRGAVDACHEARNLTNFLGMTVVSGFRNLLNPGQIRFVSVISHIEKTGLNALPIVGLLSFLIGVVLAFQGSDQLTRFGADIFTVDLLGISIFREMGVLLTAIVVAGRSGSAFAAELGTMHVNQEVDAMRTMGLDPVDILVLPRMLALVIAMPLLAVFANIMGIAGGGMMVIATLDVTVAQFLERLSSAVSTQTFWIGIIKAPVFGLLIALTGCREGLLVTGSAESVGLHTTRAVVISLFLVIVADAAFSVLFSVLGI
jgi:phospholipid/cholesterol/gamma-HCH transport system permease protein